MPNKLKLSSGILSTVRQPKYGTWPVLIGCLGLCMTGIDGRRVVAAETAADKQARVPQTVSVTRAALPVTRHDPSLSARTFPPRPPSVRESLTSVARTVADYPSEQAFPTRSTEDYRTAKYGAEVNIPVTEAAGRSGTLVRLDPAAQGSAVKSMTDRVSTRRKPIDARTVP
ncbi:MAG: hypothetical protein U0795_19145 [Pirellulales bacterium]